MRRRGRGDDGAAAVEFALLLPVLLAIVLGAIDFALAFRQQIVLHNAAGAGATYAAAQPCDKPGIRNLVVNDVQSESPSLAASLPSASDVGFVTYFKADGVTPATCATAYEVKVKVTAPYDWLTGKLLSAWANLPAQLHVTGSETARVQG